MTDKKDWHIFRPQSSINVYELAQIIEAMGFNVTREVIEKLPTHVQRHFVKAQGKPTNEPV